MMLKKPDKICCAGRHLRLLALEILDIVFQKRSGETHCLCFVSYYSVYVGITSANVLNGTELKNPNLINSEMTTS